MFPILVGDRVKGLSHYCDWPAVQDCRHSDEAVLQGEPGGEDRIPEGRRGGHQETPLVPGQSSSY